MRHIRFTIVLLVALCNPGTAQPPVEELLFKTYAERAPKLLYFYNAVINKADSLTIFNAIDRVENAAVANKDDDLAAEAALMRVHYFYYRQDFFSREKVLAQLASLKKRAVKEKRLWLEIMVENLLALYNYNTNFFEQAFVHHLYVYHLIRDLPPAEFPHKQNCLRQMGEEYYRFNEFAESIYYLREAIHAAPPVPMAALPVEPSLLNTIGLAYQKINRLDSADYYFRLTSEAARRLGSITWECIASGNLGYSHYLRGEYDQAIPLLQKDVVQAVKDADWSLASGSQMVLAAISLQRKQIGLAEEQLQQARQYVYHAPNSYQRLEVLYPLLAKLYAWRDLPESTAIFLDSALLVKDSLSRAFNSKLLLRANQRVETERYNAEIENIRNQRRINILERNFLIGAVLLALAIFLFFYREQKRKQRQRDEAAARTKQELASATKQLHDFTRHIAEKNAIIELMETQQGDAVSEALRQIQARTLLTDDDWIFFRDLFEKVHPGFLQRLKQKAPELTPAEIRFIVLFKLDLSGKEMAAMLGIGADAVRQVRSRVRKKLDLADEGSLDAWVATV